MIPAESSAAIPAIIEGIHGAFSLATAQTFWLGVCGSIVAVLAAIAIKEIPLRQSNSDPVPTQAGARTPAPVATAAGSSASAGTSAASTTE